MMPELRFNSLEAMSSLSTALGYAIGYFVGAGVLRILTFNTCRARSLGDDPYTFQRGVYFDRDYDGRIVVHEDLVAVSGVILAAFAAIVAGGLGLQFLR